jgi:hypothetical protein
MPAQPLLSFRGEHTRVPLLLRILGRYFVTGQQLRGPGDNATLFHHATVDYRARPYVKLTRRKWERLARRHAAITVPIWLALAAITPWVPLLALWVYLAAGVTAAAAWSVRRGVLAFRTRKVDKEWIDPAAKVLSVILGTRYVRRAARRGIQLPPGWGAGRVGQQERLAARVTIPPGTALSVALKRKIVENVGARLGIPAPVSADWREAGTDVCVELYAAPLPPAAVTWADLRSAIAEAADDTVIVGRKTGGHLVSVSLTEDSPHFLMSGAAGTGKTVLGRVFMVQRAIKGDGLVILDPKRFSHWRWAGGGKLPRDRVIYAYRDADLHEAWMAVGEEIKRRIELPEDELEKQRRVFVVVEEANVQTKKLIRYWRGVRKELMLAAKQAQADDGPFEVADLDPPVQSPAVVAMQESVCMGREIKIHVVVMAQRASASVFGGNGGDIRESFQGGRFIARWDRKLWKMLVDTLTYVACPTGPRGIWGLAQGEEFHIFRVPWLSEADALAEVLDSGPVHGPVLGAQGGHGQVDSTATPAISSAVTLAMALDSLPGQSGPAALSLDGLRTASRRPGFPAPLAKVDGTEYGRTEPRLYDLEELIQWRELARQIDA